MAAVAFGACTPKASIDCTVAQAPESSIIVKQLNMNSYTILDTVKTDANGRFKYKVDVKKAEPEFIYLYYGETNIAALLLEVGENAVVSTDTLGVCTIEGSEGSVKLQEVSRRYSDFIYRMASLVEMADDPSLPTGTRIAVQEEMTKLYVNHYRESVKYVMQNPYSLTVIPVLYEQLSEYSLVFSQPTDAVLFSSAHDSLATVYPDSRYVKALAAETQRRMKNLELNSRLSSAETISFVDINIPDINGEKQSLTAVSKENKVVLLHFWSSTDAAQKMFNQDYLKPLYDEFHSKGFQIYSVCIDPDKALWAASVKAPGFGWINVNDGLGTASPVLASYNVVELPTSILIVDGEILDESISGSEGLRKVLRRELK